MPQGAAPAPAQHKSRKALITTVVIVLVLLGLALWFTKMSAPETTYDEAGNPIYHAREGSLTPEFPRELLLEQDADIETSYTIAYQNGAGNMPYAQYTSSKSFFENVTGYRRMLQNTGWIIQRDAVETEDAGTNFYATKESAEVNITLAENEDGTVSVKIAYIMK